MTVREMPQAGAANLDQVLTLDMLHVSDGFGIIRPDSTYDSSTPHGRRLQAAGVWGKRGEWQRHGMRHAQRGGTAHRIAGIVIVQLQAPCHAQFHFSPIRQVDGGASGPRTHLVERDRMRPASLLARVLCMSTQKATYTPPLGLVVVTPVLTVNRQGLLQRCH